MGGDADLGGAHLGAVPNAPPLSWIDPGQAGYLMLTDPRHERDEPVSVPSCVVMWCLGTSRSGASGAAGAVQWA